MPISHISRRPSHAAPHTSELAHEFSRVLREWLTDDEMEQVIERNAEVDDPRVCASHDFCDANMAMYEAFERVMGHPIDTRKKADVAMWDKAWNMAKASDFAVGRKKRMNPGERTDRSAMLEAQWARLSAMRPAQRRAAVVGMSRDESLALAEWDATGEYPDPHSKMTLTQAHKQLLKQLNEDKEPTMRVARANPKTTPTIYVANLAAYNAGRLKGKWIEPSTDADELAEQVAEAIGGNVNRDEWAFHDYAGFPNMGENPSLKAVAEMAELLEEHPYAVVKAASDAGFVRHNDVDALREWLDEGYGVYESKRDYVEQMVDDMGGPSALGKQAINSYFDYEAFGRKVAMEAEEEESERLEGMSDSEIGESVIDELYGDKIPKDLADDYFDYDAYARDVFMEVASVRTPEGLVVFNAR